MNAQRNTIIWDLDGTLVDSAMDITIATNRLLKENDLNELTLEQVRGMIGNGVGLLLKRAFKAVARPIQDADFKNLETRFLQLYIPNAANKTSLYPNVIATLERFAQAGFAQGVCTNKPVLPTQAILKQLGIEQYFAAVVGGDSLTVKKPSPEPLYECMEILGANASNTLMIGDSAVDSAAASSARIPLVFISHGYCHVPSSELTASLQVDSFTELSADKLSNLY